MSGIRTYATTSDGLRFNELIVLPTMPVITLAGSDENSMGRGGLDQPGRRRLFEANPSGAGDPDDGDEPLMVGEAPPEDDPAEVLLIVPTEEDVEGVLAGHIYTEEQTALLELAQSGEGDSEAAWASLVDSLTASFALHMIDQLDPF
jgi:hypothetical protein